jgi:hypothetical protein
MAAVEFRFDEIVPAVSGERGASIWTPHLSVTFEHLNSENL